MEINLFFFRDKPLPISFNNTVTLLTETKEKDYATFKYDFSKLRVGENYFLVKYMKNDYDIVSDDSLLGRVIASDKKSTPNP